MIFKINKNKVIFSSNNKTNYIILQLFESNEKFVYMLNMGSDMLNMALSFAEFVKKRSLLNEERSPMNKCYEYADTKQ